MEVRLDTVKVDIAGTRIIDGVSLDIRAGRIAGLVGPNGSGKSTLLRTLYRHLRPAGGTVFIGPDDLWGLSARENARRVAAVPQERPTEFGFSVREVVAMGRLPHARGFAGDTSDGHGSIEEAMTQVGITHVAGRSFATLSGGERQRVLLARALVQATPVLVLDEPTNHLDIRHQLDLLELVRALGLTTVMAIHDLNLAATYCHTLHVLRAGALVAAGPTSDVLTPELISDVFEVHATRHVDADGTLRLTFGRAGSGVPPVGGTTGGPVVEDTPASGPAPGRTRS